MKSTIIISSILLIIFLVLLTLGSILDPEVNIRQDMILEAPQAVVWNNLTDFKSFRKWDTGSTFENIRIDSLNNNVFRLAKYKLYADTMVVTEKLVLQNESHIMTIFHTESMATSYLENAQSRISTRRLADGSTEIIWELRYTVRPLLARILNYALFQSQLNGFMSTTLSNLKSFVD